LTRVPFANALLIALLASAPAWGETSAEADVRLVRQVASGIIASDNARDLAGVLAAYAEDAVLLPPGEEPMRGKAAIKPRYEALFERFSPEIVGEIEELHVGGDWAFVLGRNRGRLVPRAGGEPRTLNDVYVMVLRREAGAIWHIARLMWHPAGPADGR